MHVHVVQRRVVEAEEEEVDQQHDRAADDDVLSVVARVVHHREQTEEELVHHLEQVLVQVEGGRGQLRAGVHLVEKQVNESQFDKEQNQGDYAEDRVGQRCVLVALGHVG